MTNELKGLALLGLGVFCPAALAVAAVAEVGGRIAGAAYREAVRDANDLAKREFEGVEGASANAAAASTSAIGEFLSPFTGGVTAVWMGVQAYRVRERTRAAVLAQIQGELAHPPTRGPAPARGSSAF